MLQEISYFCMRNSIIPAVFVIFRRGDAMLVGRRLGAWGSGLLCLPGGHVEKGESFSQAAIRESVEEVGLVVLPENLKPCHLMNRTNAEGEERIDAYFFVDVWSGEPVNNEPEKCSELLWVPVHDLPADIVPILKLGIERIQKGLFYSEDRIR